MLASPLATSRVSYTSTHRSLRGNASPLMTRQCSSRPASQHVVLRDQPHYRALFYQMADRERTLCAVKIPSYELNQYHHELFARCAFDIFILVDPTKIYIISCHSGGTHTVIGNMLVNLVAHSRIIEYKVGSSINWSGVVVKNAAWTFNPLIGKQQKLGRHNYIQQLH